MVVGGLNYLDSSSAATDWPLRIFGTRVSNRKLPGFPILGREELAGLFVAFQFLGLCIPEYVAFRAIGNVSELGNRRRPMADFDITNRQLAALEAVEEIPAVRQIVIVRALFSDGLALVDAFGCLFWNDLESGTVQEHCSQRTVEADAIAVAVEPGTIALAILIDTDEARVWIRNLQRVGCFAIVLQVKFASLSRDL